MHGGKGLLPWIPLCLPEVVPVPGCNPSPGSWVAVQIQSLMIQMRVQINEKGRHSREDSVYLALGNWPLDIYTIKWKLSLTFYPILSFSVTFWFSLNHRLLFAEEESGELTCVLSFHHNGNQSSGFNDMRYPKAYRSSRHYMEVWPFHVILFKSLRAMEDSKMFLSLCKCRHLCCFTFLTNARIMC